MANGGVWRIAAADAAPAPASSRPAPAPHGFVLSRDARRLFISNRGEGTISVLDLRTNHLVARWRIPGGGSPDMGGVSASGRVLWLSGRWNSEVYAISTRTGHLLRRIRVGPGASTGCRSGRNPGATRWAHRYVALSAGSARPSSSASCGACPTRGSSARSDPTAGCGSSSGRWRRPTGPIAPPGGAATSATSWPIRAAPCGPGRSRAGRPRRRTRERPPRPTRTLTVKVGVADFIRVAGREP